MERQALPFLLRVEGQLVEGPPRAGQGRLAVGQEGFGHRPVVGLGGAAARPNRNYGQELAERGYVTIATPYPAPAPMSAMRRTSFR